jgi:hypothetical protein
MMQLVFWLEERSDACRKQLGAVWRVGTASSRESAQPAAVSTVELLRQQPLVQLLILLQLLQLLNGCCAYAIALLRLASGQPCWPGSCRSFEDSCRCWQQLQIAPLADSVAVWRMRTP